MRRGSFHGRARQWFTPKGAMTNVLLSGGCLYVPDAEYRDFLAVCAECTEAGEAIYVVERPSAQIRFYADFDAQVPAEWSRAQLDAFVDSVAVAFARSACTHLGTNSPTVVLCAPTTPKAGTQKVGIHLVMPHTRVSVAQAEATRTLVLADLEALPPPVNGWADAFDESVYRQGGLRLVGARKMVPCGCGSECAHPNRKVDAGRPYLLRHVIDAHGEVEPQWTKTLGRNPVMRTLMSSIRLPCDGPAERAEPRKRQRAAPGARGGGRLADMVQGELHPMHRDLGVVSVSGTVLRVDGSGCRYCPNVERLHTQSTVYFTLGPDGVTLRCHCKKGTCPTYRGPALPLTRHGAAHLGLALSRSGLPPGFA